MLLKFLDVNEFTKNLKPVTSTILVNSSGEFNEEGLQSEVIFGPTGTGERTKTFSFIQLSAIVIHPEGLRILIQLDRKINKMISTELSFNVDESGNFIEDPNGITGINSFIQLFPNIKFRLDSPERKKLYEVVSDAYTKGTLFIDKIPVIPPEFRSMYYDDVNKEWVTDGMNDYYITIMRRSQTTSRAGGSGPLFDNMNYGLQQSINDIADFVRLKISKKHGLIRNQMLGKRVDFSGRGVITCGPSLKSNEIGVPLRMAVSLYEPFLIYQLLNSGRYKEKDLEPITEFTGQEVTIDTIKKVIYAIRTNDKIPNDLYQLFKEATILATEGKLILAKRDPCIHPESVRSFYPKIIEGSTIQIANISTSSFNADFDGDSCDCYITLSINDENVTLHISEVIDKYAINKIDNYTRNDGAIVSKYLLESDIKIKAIDKETGTIDWKEITEFSKHENLKMYKIEDTLNRFNAFWASEDHSLIIYDESDNSIKEISPVDLLTNPEGKYLIQRKEI